MKSYLTIRDTAETEIVIRRSRFICKVKRVESEDEAEAFIRERSAEYKDATHNCSAFVLNPEGSQQRFSDDGEPQGTAGQPMLEVLKKRGLTNVAAVVTRYFGGVKLGAGGLVGAYTRSVAEACDKAEILTAVYSAVYKVSLSYQQAGKLGQLLAGVRTETLETEYADGVTLTLAVDEACEAKFLGAVSELTAGSTEPALLRKEYKLYK